MKQAIKEIIRFPLRKRVLRGTFRGPLLRGAAGRGRRYARTRTEVPRDEGGNVGSCTGRICTFFRCLFVGREVMRFGGMQQFVPRSVYI